MDVTSEWAAIVKLLVIGNERGQLNNQSVNEESLLSRLANINQLKKAHGNIILKSNKVDPVPGEDSLESLHPNSIHHFNLILDGTFSNSLQEFTDLLVHHNKKLPPESIPILLNECLRDVTLWQKVKRILGPTGKWLQQMNPDWQALEPVFEITNWALGTPEERIFVFKQLRQEQPLQAIALLERNWDAEHISMQQELLNALKVGRSKADEVFLEEQLKHSKEEIRWIAAQLLIQIEDSAFLKQVIQFVEPCLTWNTDQQIVIHLPEKIPALISALNTNRKEQKVAGIGKKSNSFYQILSAVPPKHWEGFLDKNADQLVRLFAKSDWNTLLLNAMIRASDIHQDVNWMEALGRFWMKSNDQKHWNNRRGKALIEKWPAYLFNKMVVHYFNFNPGLPQGYHLVIYLLQTNQSPWDNKLALRIIKIIKDWLSSSHSLSWSGDAYKSILENASYRIDPDLFNVLQEGWPSHSRLWGLWQKDVETFMRTLLFRKEMRDTIINAK